MEKLNIKVSLANRLYPMNVDPNEEEVIRISVSKIEKMIKNFREKYSVRDDQDLLAMCALQLSVGLEKIELGKINDNKAVIKNILDIKKDIADVINDPSSV